jgi:ABC-type glycerol-3-phosphate transport system permease component
MFKTIISWTIGIVIAYAIVKVLFWILNFAFSLIFLIIMLGLIVLIALPISKAIQNKLFLKK